MKAAEESVWVYSPYLDDLVVRLLGNSELDAEDLAVVTDLSPESGTLSYRRQLLAIRRLLSQDVEVRSLPGLHAKVLLVDGKSVTVGSQNFTSYARKSKEATAVPALDMSKSRLVDTLKRWYDEAEPVDLRSDRTAPRRPRGAIRDREVRDRSPLRSVRRGPRRLQRESAPSSQATVRARPG